MVMKKIASERLFLEYSKLSAWSKKSDSDCLNESQSCHFSNQINFSENMSKW